MYRGLIEKLPKTSFYRALAELGPRLFSDNDWADLYCRTNGRPSISPSLICKVLLLKFHEDVSDEEALRRLVYDLRWKYALGLEVGDEGFDRSVLSKFRARILVHKKEEFLFDQIIAASIKLGLLDPESDQLIDTTSVLGRGAVQDTFELLRTEIQKVLRAVGKSSASIQQEVIGELGLEDYLASTGKAKIDWRDKGERTKHLEKLVGDARALLSRLSGSQAASDEQVRTSTGLLRDILDQDITPPDEPPEIKRGVAKDRVVSTTDPSMRHGRKSSSDRFAGHKIQVTESADGSELITNVEVISGNAHDSEKSLETVKSQKTRTGCTPRRVIGDMAYGTADNRAEFSAEGIEIISRTRTSSGEMIGKDEFEIDLDAMTCRCPGGHVAAKIRKARDDRGRRVRMFVFSKEACGGCALKSRCTKGASRSVRLHYHERHMQAAREREKEPDFEGVYLKRCGIERKIWELVGRCGLRQARFMGHRKVRLQALFTAAAVNLKRLYKLLLDKGLPIAEALRFSSLLAFLRTIWAAAKSLSLFRRAASRFLRPRPLAFPRAIPLPSFATPTQNRGLAQAS
jgi:transposase